MKFFKINVGFLFLLAIVSCKPNKEQKPELTNILFIAVDDLNDWLGCLGGHPNAKTPNLDRLASQGILFSNAHCQAPLCGPSRASLMSGLRPSTTGIYGMIDDNEIKSAVDGEITFLPEYFKENGYYTMGIGKLFHHHAPDSVFDESGGRAKGFGPYPKERFVWDGFGTSDRKNYGRTSTDWGAFPESDSLMPDHQSADWVIERLHRNYEKPFFLAVGFLRPHVPWYVPQKWFDMHPLDSITLPPYKEDDLEDVPPVALKINDLPMMPSTQWAIESGEWPSIIQAYLACVSFVDYEIGRVLDALENSKYTQNTVVVLWADHGYRLGEKGTFAKHCLWEEATNAPLIFAGKNLPKGKKIDEPVEMLSIYPTLLEICDLQSYEKNEGKSLLPMINGKDKLSLKNAAITTFGMNNHSVRTESFRYIRYEDGGEELYDHTEDPNEWLNLSNDNNEVEIKNELKGYLPEINKPWAEESSYNSQPYFVEQKKRILSEER